MFSTSAPRRARFRSPAFVALLGALALVGLTAVPLSLTGDQALFTIAAERLARGGVLYRDFWDLKQPGIFAWYLAAGTAFGFTEIGIHLAELAYELAFAGVLYAALRARGTVVAVTAPLLAVGLWYAAADEAALTQVEALAGLPLFVGAWTACVALERKRPRLFVACGIAAGIAVALKLLFAPIVVATAIVAVAVHRPSVRTLGSSLAWFVCGFACAVGPIVSYFLFTGTLGIAAWTNFVLPAVLVRSLPHQHVAVLAQTVHGFCVHWIVASAFAAYAVVDVIRSRRRDALACAMLAWAAVGVAVFLAQTLSWWPYQSALLVPPLAVLAALGVGRATGRRFVFSALAVVAILLPTASHLGKRVVLLVRAHGAWTPADRERFQEASAPRWPLAAYLRVARSLPPPPTRRDDLYVFGQPLIYLQSGRLQPVPINGWSPTLLVPMQWARLADSLARDRPRFLCFDRTAPEDVAALRQGGAPVLAVRERLYHLIRRTPENDLYEYTARRSSTL